MKWIYSCPHCNGTLNPDDSVMLVANHAGLKVLVGLHPEPGVYTMHVPPEVDIREGSRWELSCPLCRADLRSELNEDLCALDMTCGGDPHRVYFSRIAGERATFVVTAEGLLSDFGVHTDRYLEHLVHDSFR